MNSILSHFSEMNSILSHFSEKNSVFFFLYYSSNANATSCFSSASSMIDSSLMVVNRKECIFGPFVVAVVFPGQGHQCLHMIYYWYSVLTCCQCLRGICCWCSSWI